MLLSLTELPHSSAPMTSTPNKLTIGMASLLTNGNHSTSDDGVTEATSSPGHCLLDSSEIESKDVSTSDFNTTAENQLLSWGSAGGDVEVTPSSRVPSPRTGEMPGGGDGNESGYSDRKTPEVTGYTRCQNSILTSEVEDLKQRLLSALTDMIPHEESLSLRVLVNYTIDGADSECLVIDETLRRHQGAESKETGSRVRKSQYDSGPEFLDIKRRRKRHQFLYKEVPALDLSKQDDCLDDGATLARNRREEGGTEDATYRKEGGVTIRQDLAREVADGVFRAPVLSMLNGSGVYDKGASAITNGSGVTPGIPILDPSIASLLPFLQQQLQQQQVRQRHVSQQQQQNQEKEQNSVNQIGYQNGKGQTEIIPGNCQPSQSDLTAESLLVKQLQALVDNGNCMATSSTNDGTKKTDSCTNSRTDSTNLGAVHSSVDNITATLLSGSTGIGTCGGVGLGSTVNTTTNSVIGLPFLNALSAEQLSALLPSSSYIGQSKSGNSSVGAVNSMLGANGTNRPILLNSMAQQQPLLLRDQEQDDGSRIPAGGFTSVNLGSATLLNLRDKMTGLETLGILPVTGNRSFTQPMTNLLNHIGQTTSGIPTASVSTPVSLQKLSSFSNFFNSLTNTTLAPAPPSSPPVSTSITTAPMTSTSSNPSSMGVASNPFSLSFPLSLPLPLPRTAVLPTSLNTSVSVDSTAVTPTTLLTMLPNISSTNEVVDMLTSLNSVGSLDRNNLVSLETLTAAVDRMKNQMPSNTESSEGRKVGSDTGMIPIIKTLDSSGFVNSPGSAGESHDSSPSSANNLMFGRRLVNNRRFICNQCRKNYSSLAELNRHTLEAHNSFKCTICSAHFTQRSNLQRHSLKHVGFKPFTCNLCKKEYYRKDHLVRHIEVTHPNHDPKMNITVHLTSSECLEYLDRINTGKQTPSPCDPENQTVDDIEMADEEYLKIDEGNPEESGTFQTEPLEVQQFEPAVASNAQSPS